MFAITWTSHGGSGLNASWADALDFAPSDRDWLLDRIAKQRKYEADEIRKARGRS